MTGGDFLVLAPWALFAAGLAVLALRLRRPRWLARRGPVVRGGRPGTPGRAGGGRRRPGGERG